MIVDCSRVDFLLVDNVCETSRAGTDRNTGRAVPMACGPEYPNRSITLRNETGNGGVDQSTEELLLLVQKADTIKMVPSVQIRTANEG